MTDYEKTAAAYAAKRAAKPDQAAWPDSWLDVYHPPDCACGICAGAPGWYPPFEYLDAVAFEDDPTPEHPCCLECGLPTDRLAHRDMCRPCRCAVCAVLDAANGVTAPNTFGSAAEDIALSRYQDARYAADLAAREGTTRRRLDDLRNAEDAAYAAWRHIRIANGAAPEPLDAAI